MSALLTDLYELTMAAGYVAAGKQHERATFELFVRRLPPNRDFLIAAGLAQAVDYLLNLQFQPAEIDYLRGLPIFAAAPPAFFEALANLRFTGDVFAVPEGTPMFAGEPLLTVRAPLIEAQIVETFLLATIGFQTMIASKAARVVEAAAGRAVVEFGTRRAHSPEAGTLAARAAFIGGCAGTSNTEAGFRYGIPVFGTAAHSWVQSFPTEDESFRKLQALLGPATVHLIDTYDTLDGARRAASLGAPIWGVRIDSGDFAGITPKVRRILDDAGLTDAKIMVSGDLNEYKLRDMMAAGLPIDAMGVGTELATSADAPTLGVVYKLVEIESGGASRPITKLSQDKITYPGAKQVFRLADRDIVGCASECNGCGEVGVEALLRPILLCGETVHDLPTVSQARDRVRDSLRTLRLPRRVEYSEQLQALHEKVSAEYAVE